MTSRLRDQSTDYCVTGGPRVAGNRSPTGGPRDTLFLFTLFGFVNTEGE